jgi:hypothetical protein
MLTLQAPPQRAGARAAPAAAQPARRASGAAPAIPRQNAPCACGGGCPRCQGGGLQRKAQFGAPGDRHEREADSVADLVMRAAGPAAPSIGRAALPRADDADPAVRTARRGGAPLPHALREYFEPRFGRDLGSVRVHADSEAASAALAISARAYTSGTSIVFGAGEYTPATAAGRHLLAHELTHVVQQSGSAGAVQRMAQTGAGEEPLTGPAPSPTGAGTPVYVCTKDIMGSTVHRQGHAFFRVGGTRPGLPTYELEHARSCPCGWQGWPRRNVPEDRDADVPCVLTPISATLLASVWNTYPVGQYCARGPNSNTYVRVVSAMCGSLVRPPRNTAGYDAAPPPAGGAGAPHPFLSVVTCWNVDCDDTECGLIPGINSDIVPGRDPEAMNTPEAAPGEEQASA